MSYGNNHLFASERSAASLTKELHHPILYTIFFGLIFFLLLCLYFSVTLVNDISPIEPIWVNTCAFKPTREAAVLVMTIDHKQATNTPVGLDISISSSTVQELCTSHLYSFPSQEQPTSAVRHADTNLCLPMHSQNTAPCPEVMPNRWKCRANVNTNPGARKHRSFPMNCFSFFGVCLGKFSRESLFVSSIKQIFSWKVLWHGYRTCHFTFKVISKSKHGKKSNNL